MLVKSSVKSKCVSNFSINILIENYTESNHLNLSKLKKKHELSDYISMADLLSPLFIFIVLIQKLPFLYNDIKRKGYSLKLWQVICIHVLTPRLTP